MGAAAMKTSRIKLCAGVFIPSNRIAPVAANALATLNALAPGRVVFGVSTGYTGRRTMGLGPVTLARMEKYIKVVEGLLKGKTVEWSGEGGPHKVRFLNPDLGLININDPIPTFISAFGPKARALTAKLGANWIGEFELSTAREQDIEDMHTKWKAAGRDVKNFYVAASSGGSVLDEGEPADSRRDGAGRTLRCDRVSQPGGRGSVRLGVPVGRISRSRRSWKPIARSTRATSQPTPAISAITAAT